MSGEKLELLQRFYEAWNSEETRVEDVLPLLHPEFELVNPDYAVESGTRRGHEGWIASVKTSEDAFSEYRHDPYEFIEAGDRILALTRFKARTRVSGVPYEVDDQHLWSFREGKVSRVAWFHNLEEAREAAGLSPLGDLILVVDPDLEIARAMEGDLKRVFGSKGFWFRALDSSEAALELLRRLRQQGGRMALLVADDETEPIGGLDLISQAHELHPELKAIALVAHKRYDLALEGLTKGHIDRQLVKPISPDGEQLISAASELLADWTRKRDYSERAVRLVGDPETGEAWRLRDFLARNDIQYLLVPADSPEGKELIGDDGPAEPVVVLANGTRLSAPSLLELTQALGMSTKPKGSEYDLVIVGGGPAGLAGAVYAASEGLRTCLIEREAPGGQAGLSSRIENYLGFPSGLTGLDLSQRALAQCRRFGAELVRLKVAEGLRAESDRRVLTLQEGDELRASAVLISCGVSYRRLEVPGMEELVGRGVNYGGAATEAERFADRPVAIVGGANSAGQAALKFAERASKVTMLVRGESIERSMATYLCKRIHAHPKIELRTETTVAAASGETGLEAIQVEGPGGRETVAVEGLFIFIGAVPHTDWLEGTVARDERGFILTGREAADACAAGAADPWPLGRDPYPLEASIPGVFAAGDVRCGSIKRVAAAVGEGGTAVQLVHQHLAELEQAQAAAEARA